MIKVELVLPDGRKIPVFLRQRSYQKLTAKLNHLGFWDKLKLLFTRKEG